MQKKICQLFSLSINFGKNIDSEYIVLNLQWGTSNISDLTVKKWWTDD